MVSVVSSTYVVPTLECLALSALANKYLADPREQQEIPFSEQIRDCYSQFFNRDRTEEIQAIKQRVVRDLQHKIVQAWQDPSRCDAIKEELRANGSFGNEWLSEMYQKGRHHFNWYVYHHNNWENTQEVAELCERWLKKVRDDFENGHILSFPQMSVWLGERHITTSFSLAKKEPFDRPDRFLPLLTKMAYLGNRQAQYALSAVYNHNRIGDDESRMQLGLDFKTRLIGLKTLASWGHAWSQHNLGMIYFSPKEWFLTEQDRRDGMKELIELESEPNFYVTTHFAESRIGELKYNYTLQERIAHLTKKAKNGNGEAFNYLWRLYTTNSFDSSGEEKIPLNLNEQERWDRLKELRTPKSEKHFSNHFNRWIVEPDGLLPCRMTVQERLAHLEKNLSIGRLVQCYIRNSWSDDTPLNIPFRERLEKLEGLIHAHKSESAMQAVAKYYLRKPNHFGPEAIVDAPDLSNQPLNERASRVIHLAVAGQQWNFIGNEVRLLTDNPELISVVKLVAAHGKAVEDFCRS